MPQVVDIAAFKEQREPVALTSRRRAKYVAGALLTVLADSEANDIMSALRFDLTPEDVNSLETFIGNVAARTEDRVNVANKNRASRRTDRQPA